MNRPSRFVFAFAAILIGTLAWFWLRVPPSGQELLANTAKALDYAAGWKSVGAPPWWTPNFLQGTSLAPALLTLLTSGWVLLWTQLAGLFAGSKIAALLALAAATVMTHALARRMTRDSWAAAVSAVAFLLASPIVFRVAHVEHLDLVGAYVLIPFALLRLTVLVEKPTRLNGLLCGMAFALLLLTSARTVLLLLPLATAFALILWIWKQRTWRAPGSVLLITFAAVMVLGVLPLLPAWREWQLATASELSPWEAFQKIFSLKNVLPGFDRQGLLSAGTAPGFAPTSAQGSYYLGLVPILLLSTIFLFRPTSLYASRIGFLCRLFVSLTLLSTWLSFGPHSVVTGQIAFLKTAFGAQDLVIAISWFLLIGQGWILLRLLPPSLPGRRAIGSALIAIYLLVPGFQLLSWLPFYSQLRSPEDFFQVVGIFFWILATGCGFRLALTRLPLRFPRLAFALILLTAAVWDVSPHFRPFFQGSLPATTFQDFEDAGKFLSEAKEPGWVLPLSGRYFYLLTPHVSHRSLTSEAFQASRMQRMMAHFQAVSHLSAEFLKASLDLRGVSFVLIDKTDPGTPKEIQNQYESLLAPAFENESFLILKNTSSLAPAFLSSRFISGEASLDETIQVSLELAKKGIIVLPNSTATYAAQPTKVGFLKEGAPVLDENLPPAAEVLFPQLALEEPRDAHFQRISLAPPNKSGWAIFPESYHPDWQAVSADGPLAVLPADGALLAVEITDPSQAIILNFVPPWWYNGFLLASALGWISSGILLAVGLLPSLPGGKLKSWLCRRPGFAPRPPAAPATARNPIDRALVIIPTYNEAQTLPEAIDRVLAHPVGIEILVVDDHSPDGTADLVRTHPQYGTRLHLLARSGKLGLGSAYREGFQWAFARHYDACLEMDADLSHDPADIPRLIEGLNQGADATIGSRYLGGVRVMNWSESRLFLSTGASRFVRLVTGLPLTDATSGFKALRCSVLKTLDWKSFRTEGYGFQVELHHALWQSGARLQEIPIVFTERRDGETKMTFGIALEAAWRTLRLAFERK